MRAALAQYSCQAGAHRPLRNRLLQPGETGHWAACGAATCRLQRARDAHGLHHYPVQHRTVAAAAADCRGGRQRAVPALR